MRAPAPPPAEPRHDHTVAQVTRRAIVVRARFDRELQALVDELHAIRETLHGHTLPHEHDGTPEPGEDER